MKIAPIAKSRIAEILLVDDNDDYVYLAQEAFSAANVHVNLQRVDNGVKCLQYLRKQFPYEDAITPDLILLDMYMPVMGGHQVLAAIAKDECLKHLLVVVLTTSSDSADIQKMYELRCNSYITKPVVFDDFLKVIAQISSYWLGLVVVPVPN